MWDEITAIYAIVSVHWGLFRPASPSRIKPANSPGRAFPFGFDIKKGTFRGAF
jgi:hypothetical protein